MKKLVLALIILGSVSTYAKDNLVIDKQVTGINKEIIEERKLGDTKIELKEAEVSGKDLKVSNRKIKNNEESLEIKNSDDNLKKELATDVKKESSLWKYIVGALGIVAIAVAL